MAVHLEDRGDPFRRRGALGFGPALEVALPLVFRETHLIILEDGQGGQR